MVSLASRAMDSKITLPISKLGSCILFYTYDEIGAASKLIGRKVGTYDVLESSPYV